MVAAPPGEERLDIHREFHAALIRPAASKWDLRLLSPLWDAAERCTRLVFDPVDWSDDMSAERHRANLGLIAACRSDDPTEVEAELRAHLEANLNTIVRRLSPVASTGLTSWLAQDDAREDTARACPCGRRPARRGRAAPGGGVPSGVSGSAVVSTLYTPPGHAQRRRRVASSVAQ
mgnify:FL=1